VFCARALVGFLCILFVYLEAYCAFLIIQFYLLIKKKLVIRLQALVHKIQQIIDLTFNYKIQNGISTTKAKSNTIFNKL
jgi:hypothetical protein